MIDRRVPTTVITGFLGSGKTTLIRHLLTGATNERLALIINEFGDVGVDGAIARGCDAPSCGADDIIELANGCICCTVADDFLPGMEALLDRAPPPDRIIIETSGLALPQPLVQAFQWPAIRTRAMLDGVVTLVDGEALAGGSVAHDEAALQAQREADPELDHDTPVNELFLDQLAAANILVVTKTDLMDAEARLEVKERLAGLTGGSTPIVESSAEHVPAAALLGLGLEQEALKRSLHYHHHHHDDEHDDEDHDPNHDPNDHDHDHDAFATFVIDVPILDDPDAVVAALENLALSAGLLRAKGFLGVKGKRAPLVVQAVGDRVQHYFAPPSPPDDADSDAARGRLVVIGYKGLAVDQIAAAIGGRIL